MPFEKGKNADELRIRKDAKFRVVGGDIFKKGDILIFKKDYGSGGDFMRLSDGRIDYKDWSNLEYASFKPTSLDNFSVEGVGMMIESENGNKRKILALDASGKCICYSRENDFTVMADWKLITDIKGWRLIPESESHEDEEEAIKLLTERGRIKDGKVVV
jgi:hypothetical protein